MRRPEIDYLIEVARRQPPGAFGLAARRERRFAWRARRAMPLRSSRWSLGRGLLRAECATFNVSGWRGPSFDESSCGACWGRVRGSGGAFALIVSHRHKFIFLIRYENLQEGFNEVCRRVNVAPRRLLKLKT